MDKQYKTRAKCNYARKFIEEVVIKAITQLEDSVNNQQTKLQFNNYKQNCTIFEESLNGYCLLFDTLKINFTSKYMFVKQVYLYIAGHNMKMSRDKFFKKLKDPVRLDRRNMPSVLVQVFIPLFQNILVIWVTSDQINLDDIYLIFYIFPGLPSPDHCTK